MGRQRRPACIVYILDGSETRLLRIVVVAEGRSTSIDFTGRWNQAKKLAVRSVFEQYWSSAVFLRRSWKISEKKKKEKGKSWYTTYYELLIYDWLLRQTRSMPRGCLSLFVPSFFVSCWWPWKTFHRSRFFLMEGKSGSWEFFSWTKTSLATQKLKAEELCGRECYGVINYSFIAK